MTGHTPRYGLSLASRGVLFGVTSVDDPLDMSEQTDASGAFPPSILLRADQVIE